MQRRRRINPKEDATFYVTAGRDKVGLDIQFISAFKGRGIFTTTPFEKGDFLLEYQGELISKQECEKRQMLYHNSLKVFMFEFYFNGKLWCVDAAKEDGSLGRLVNDNHIDPNAKMKYFNVQGKPHLCLFAVRDISPGEEITYNYGDSDWPWRSKKYRGLSSDGQCAVVSSSKTSTKMPSQKAPGHHGLKKSSTCEATACPKHCNKDLNEEMPQKSPEITNSPPTNEVVEQDLLHMTREKSQTELTVSNLNQTSPVLDLLSRVGKDLNEEMPQESPEITNSPSTNEVVEQCGLCRQWYVRTISQDAIQSVDEIVFSDAEAEDSESESDESDTAFKASECGHSESVDAASVFALADKDHDTEDFGLASLVSSTADETVPSSEGKDAGQERDFKRVSKKMWSKAEVAAVMWHFRDHISKGKLATKNECSHCKLVEDPVLAQRTVQNIRDFVRNRGTAAKRQAQKQKLQVN